MDTSPDDARRTDAGSNDGEDPRPDHITPAGSARVERAAGGRPPARPCWNIEMLESPLIGLVPYAVHDAMPLGPGESAAAWIEFSRPTQLYRSPGGRHEVLIRLTVESGSLAITAPGVYPPNSLRRTTIPPPDREGNLRILRLGGDDESQIDLVMAADGTVTAELRMDTILRPFNRRDILHIADEFAGGIDLVDYAVRKSRLRLE